MLVAGWMTASNAPSGLFSPPAAIERFLETLRLQIHRDKSVVFPCEEGIRFLGYRVFPTHRLLAQENVRRFRRRMRWMQREFARGRIGFEAIRPRHHELDRPRAPCQHVSPSDRSVR